MTATACHKQAVEVSHLVDFGPLAGESVPQNDGALIVAAGQKVLVITAPADTATKIRTLIKIIMITHQSAF